MSAELHHVPDEITEQTHRRGIAVVAGRAHYDHGGSEAGHHQQQPPPQTLFHIDSLELGDLPLLRTPSFDNALLPSPPNLYLTSGPVWTEHGGNSLLPLPRSEFKFGDEPNKPAANTPPSPLHYYRASQAGQNQPQQFRHHEASSSVIVDLRREHESHHHDLPVSHFYRHICPPPSGGRSASGERYYNHPRASGGSIPAGHNFDAVVPRAATSDTTGAATHELQNDTGGAFNVSRSSEGSISTRLSGLANQFWGGLTENVGRDETAVLAATTFDQQQQDPFLHRASTSWLYQPHHRHIQERGIVASPIAAAPGQVIDASGQQDDNNNSSFITRSVAAGLRSWTAQQQQRDPALPPISSSSAPYTLLSSGFDSRGALHTQRQDPSVHHQGLIESSALRKAYHFAPYSTTMAEGAEASTAFDSFDADELEAGMSREQTGPVMQQQVSRLRSRTTATQGRSSLLHNKRRSYQAPSADDGNKMPLTAANAELAHGVRSSLAGASTVPDGGIERRNETTPASPLAVGASGSSRSVKMTPKRRRRTPKNLADQHRTEPEPCQIPFCGGVINPQNKYNRRYKMCEACMRKDSVHVDGAEVRFCQQCSCLHRLSEFDGLRRSCRQQLDRHKARRRSKEGAQRAQSK